MLKPQLFLVTLVLALFFPKIDFAQSGPNLGGTARFGVYTAAGAISVTNGINLVGDLGNHAGTIKGYSGTAYQAGNPFADQAFGDVHTLFNDLGSRTCTNTLATFVGGETLTEPGVYCFDAATTLTGTLTLTGTATDIFIINIGGVLNTADHFSVALGGDAQPQNVYWCVMGAVNLGANNTFQGTLVAEGAVSVGSNSTIYGSILVTAGAINLDGNAIESTGEVSSANQSGNGQAASTSISSITGLSNASQGNFGIIQNPVVNNRLRVNMPTAASVTIYSGLGQVLLSKAVEAGTQTIALPTLAKGIYHVKCGNVVKKFVVQ